MTVIQDLIKELRYDWWPKWLKSSHDLIFVDSENNISSWIADKNNRQNSIPRYHGDIYLYELNRYQFDRMEKGASHVDNLGAVGRACLNRITLGAGLIAAHPEKTQLRLAPVEYAFQLAFLIAIGWRDEAELVARLGLRSRQSMFLPVMSEEHRVPRLMWALICDWLDVGDETRSASEPEGDLGAWQDLFDAWRSEDDARFSKAMNAAADYHVDQSRQYDERGHVERPDEGPYLSNNYEIEDPSYWIFPVELLAVLRLRGWVGLSNPHMTHDLFTAGPFGRLPKSIARSSPPLLNAAEAKFRQTFPLTPSLDDLPALRHSQSL